TSFYSTQHVSHFLSYMLFLSSYYNSSLTISIFLFFFFFFFNDTATTEIYTLSLHDALPISQATNTPNATTRVNAVAPRSCLRRRSEEHTSELQSRFDLVCRLLLEKKKKKNKNYEKN